MRRIMSMRVTQIRIFRPDELPLAQLQSGVVTQKLAQSLELKPLSPPQVAPGLPIGAQLIYTGGQLKIDEKIVVIDQLSFDERRVILIVVGDSKASNKVFDVIRQVMLEVDQRTDKPTYEPLIMSEETTTVVELDFPITRLAAGSPLETFGEDLSKRVESFGAKAQSFLSSVRFHIHYDDLPELLKQQSIALFDKDVVIEWRIQSAVADNVFFVTSPNSSEGHLQLIAHLEKVFANEM